jgi:hypothetical protein
VILKFIILKQTSQLPINRQNALQETWFHPPAKLITPRTALRDAQILIPLHITLVMKRDKILKLRNHLQDELYSF